MLGLVERTRCADSISRALVIPFLDDSDLDDGYKQGCRNRSISRQTNAVMSHVDASRFFLLNSSLEDIRSWLDDQCAKEQTLVDWKPEYLGERRAILRREGNSGAQSPGIDTSILTRIRAGRGPRDPTYEVDLLAAVRRQPLEMIEGPEPEYVRETYQAGSKALLEWNAHISSSQYNPELARQLIEVLDERVRLFGEIQKGIAKPSVLNRSSLSSPQLLQALCALRPEIAEFRTRNPTRILYILWAHVGIAVPDMSDDLKYATMRVLLGERLLMSDLRERDKGQKVENVEAVHQKEIMTLVGSMQDGRRKDLEEVHKAVAKDTIRRIKHAREELKGKVSRQQQELTLLQAMQKQTFGNKTLALWTELHRVCVEADANLQRALLQTSDDLESNCGVLGENVRLSRRLHCTVLTRAMKFAGLDLDCDDTTREQIVKQRMDDPDTVRMMGEAVADLAGQRLAVEKVVGQMGTVESLLDLLLDAAQTQWRVYDGLLCLLNAEQGSITKIGFETDVLDECEPDREEVLLMTKELRAREDDESELWSEE